MNMTIFTIILTIAIIKIRKKGVFLVRYNLQLNEIEKKKTRSYTWYQMRTLEIKGGLESDFPGHILKKLIRSLIEKEKIKGRLLELKAVPKLNKAVVAQGKIEDLIDNY